MNIGADINRLTKQELYCNPTSKEKYKNDISKKVTNVHFNIILISTDYSLKYMWFLTDSCYRLQN